MPKHPGGDFGNMVYVDETCKALLGFADPATGRVKSPDHYTPGERDILRASVVRNGLGRFREEERRYLASVLGTLDGIPE